MVSGKDFFKSNTCVGETFSLLFGCDNDHLGFLFRLIFELVFAFLLHVLDFVPSGVAGDYGFIQVTICVEVYLFETLYRTQTRLLAWHQADGPFLRDVFNCALCSTD